MDLAIVGSLSVVCLGCFLHSLERDSIQGNAMNNAVKEGNLERMKRLKSNGYVFTTSTFSEAAGHGNIENMIWLQQNGCQFDEHTFNRAIQNGNLDNMKWLFSHGCKFNPLTLVYTFRSVSPENIKWLTDRGCKLHRYGSFVKVDKAADEEAELLVSQVQPKMVKR